MNVIIFTDADGNVNEMVPAPGYTEAQIIANYIPSGSSTPFVIDESNLPDQYFRDAWEENGAVVSVDLDGAKQIALLDVRTIADKTTGFIQRSFLLNEDPGVTQDDVTNAYEQAKQDIENATQVPFVKAAVEVFKSTYDIVED